MAWWLWSWGLSFSVFGGSCGPAEKPGLVSIILGGLLIGPLFMPRCGRYWGNGACRRRTRRLGAGLHERHHRHMAGPGDPHIPKRGRGGPRGEAKKHPPGGEGLNHSPASGGYLPFGSSVVAFGRQQLAGGARPVPRVTSGSQKTGFANRNGGV